MSRGLSAIVVLGLLGAASADADTQLTKSSSNDVTFSNQIVRVFQENCQGCHHPGGIGPFSLMTYEAAYPFRYAIADATRARRMPPWKPVAGIGEFKHVRRLPDADIGLIARWVENGAPEGDRAQLPPPREFKTAWQANEPDVVFEMAEPYSLRAGSEDIYRCFVIPTSFKEDRYVSISEVLPGNTEVVHHVITYVDRGQSAIEHDRAQPGPGYTCFGGPEIPYYDLLGLGGWAPGAPPTSLPEGVGMLLPAGATIVLQVHYHNCCTGRDQTDRTKVGLHFAKGPIDKRARSIVAINRSFEIPAGEARHVVRASYTVPANRSFQALNVTPHMHLIGREIKATVRYPDGTVRPLIYINDWDFKWQGSYTFEKPIPLPSGTVIDVEAVYDNTADNPRQPNSPPKTVSWGKSTTDEMCIVFLRVTVDQEHLANR